MKLSSLITLVAYFFIGRKAIFLVPALLYVTITTRLRLFL